MYLQNSRYEIIATQDKIAYQVDRKTGESWTIYLGQRKKNIGDNQQIEKYQTLPLEEKSKVIISKDTYKQKTPSGLSMLDLMSGTISGMLYNGSSWTVKEIIVAVKAIDKSGKIRWDRQFRDAVTILPLTTKSFSIEHGDSDITSLDWDLVGVNGNPPK